MIRLRPLPTDPAEESRDYEAFIEDILWDGWDIQELQGSTPDDSLNLYLLAKETNENNPWVFIVSAIHGDEKPSAYFAKQMLERIFAPPEDHPDRHLLLYLQRRYNWCWVPIGNPTGWVANTRVNVNGVDLNRDYNNQTQPETRAITSEIARINPLIFIDCHNTRHGLTMGTGKYSHRTILTTVRRAASLMLGRPVGEYADTSNVNIARIWTARRPGPRDNGTLSYLVESDRADDTENEIAAGVNCIWALLIHVDEYIRTGIQNPYEITR